MIHSQKGNLETDMFVTPISYMSSLGTIIMKVEKLKTFPLQVKIQERIVLLLITTWKHKHEIALKNRSKHLKLL